MDHWKLRNISGIRQGCPLSCLIFLIAAEILACKLRSETSIHGFKVNNKCTKIAQLATLFLKYKDVKKALSLVKEFAKISGLKLNKDKMEGIYLGLNNNKHNNFAGIKWVDMVKSLGVYFGRKSKVCSNLCWEEKITSIDLLIKNWKKRKLTLLCKSTIIQNVIIPKISYIASVQSISKQQIKQLEKIIYEYISDGKTDKVKRDVMIGNFIDCGLRIRDIDTHIDMLRISWIKRIKEGEEANWKAIPRFYFDKFGKDLLIFKMNTNNINLLPMTDEVPDYYRCIVILVQIEKRNQSSKDI